MSLSRQSKSKSALSATTTDIHYALWPLNMAKTVDGCWNLVCDQRRFWQFTRVQRRLFFLVAISPQKAGQQFDHCSTTASPNEVSLQLFVHRHVLSAWWPSPKCGQSSTATATAMTTMQETSHLTDWMIYPNICPVFQMSLHCQLIKAPAHYNCHLSLTTATASATAAALCLVFR